MRILLVTGEYPPDEGGVADYTRCLAMALAGAGHAVDVLASRRSTSDAVDAAARPRSAPDEEDSLASQGAAPDEAEGRRITVHRVMGHWRWGSLGKVRRTLAVLKPDVMHVQYQTAAFGLHPAVNVLPWWIRRSTDVRTAVTYHDLRVPYLFPKAGRLREKAALLPARWSHLTLATNVADWRRLWAEGRTWRLALVPIGSNIPDAVPAGYDRAAWRAGHELGADCRLVAYFGFLNASKGGRTLVSTLERLRNQGHDARLLMIGGRTGASDATNTAYLATFEADLAASGLAEQVIWTGHVAPPEVSAWLRAADVAALPYEDGASYRRGSLLACLAHGVPVVTTAPEPLLAGELEALPAEDRPPELVDGVSARLVPAGDGAAFAAAVGEVLADPDRAGRLGAGGRAVAGWFGWDRIAARHAALYGEVLQPQAP